MKNISSYKTLYWCWAVCCAVTAAATTSASAAQYLLADARIEGKEIHAFQDDSQDVTVVLGDFNLQVGSRRITGRDAVLWIQTRRVGVAVRHDITAYVEGAAAVSEPGRPTRSEPAMLVTVLSEGRLSAEGNYSDRPLLDFPLYERAKDAKATWREPAPAAPSADRVPPPLIRTPTPPEPRVPVTPEAQTATTEIAQPETAEGPVAVGEVTAEPPSAVEVVTPGTAEEVPPPQPVEYSADDYTFGDIGEFDPALAGQGSVLLARGNVYVAQGHPDSDMYLELRSQSAVLFVQPQEQMGQVTSPLGEQMPSLGPDSQSITGVYLEGDVVIARGERFFRGPAAYYDFVTGRGIILDPVFRTVQEQREIPVYIRASEARILSSREIQFADAKVTTSEFFTPTYHIGARSAYLMDTTPRDDDGRKLGEQSWRSKLQDVTFNVRGLPLLYAPIVQGDLEQGNSALRTVRVGKEGKFGWGAETEWHLFRLLGLIKPEGFGGVATFGWHEKGGMAGIDLDYARRDFTGYHMLYGVLDEEGEDDFGQDREDIDAPRERGRLLMRHKQFLPNDWQLQFELSYICDRNFLEQFFPDEFFAGKEQETLLYAKKQKDNWAFTSLLQTRINRFQTETASYPDLGLFLVGESLLDDRLTFFHESRAGVKKYRQDRDAVDAINRLNRLFGVPLKFEEKSSHFVRLDTREEINLPLHAGPVNIVPYAVGRMTYWGDEQDSLFDGSWSFRNDLGLGQEQCRPYGQIGLRANTHFWRVYNNVESRRWDIHRLKHIITPEVVTFLAGSSGVYPQELIPMDEEVEGIERTSGAVFNLHQRLQTKRGPAGERHTVDWMRLDLSAGFYDNNRDDVPSDGRFFFYRPEHSLDRNHLNGDYAWYISDSTTLLADANYDLDRTALGRGDIGLAVQRDPRLRYYYGVRYIEDVDSAAATFGVDYALSRKYTISAFEQYDFDYDNGRNLATAVTITRKFPRWYGGFTFSYDSSDNDVTLLLTFWPEGLEEVRIGGGKLSLLGASSKN